MESTPSSSPATPRTAWDHVRAALFVFHVAVITVAALPVPTGDLTDANFRDPAVRRDLATWTRLLQNVGLADDEDAAMGWLWAQGDRLLAVHEVLSTPGSWYLRPSGNHQSWRMFSRPNHHFGRLLVEGRRPDGEWTTLWVERGVPTYDPGLMDHARSRSIRTAFAYGRHRGDFRRFATWLGRRLLSEDPELTEVRVQLRSMEVPTTPGPLVDKGVKHRAVRVRRER